MSPSNTVLDRTTLKGYFETGDKPTQAQFERLIDSSVGRIVVPLSYAATITTDLTAGFVFKVTITGNLLLENPTGGVDGTSYMWRIKQDGTGGRTVSLGTKFTIPSSATTPLAWSTDPNAMDMLVAQYDSDADLFYVTAMIPGY
jgi:hypothetical protein